MSFFDRFKSKTAEFAKDGGEKARELAKVGGEKAKELAKVGSAKAKQLAEITKLKAANISLEETARKTYLELGKLYYARNAITAEGDFAELCNKITEAKAAVEVNNAKIEELKLDATPDEETLVTEVAETAPEAAAETAEQVAAAAEEVREAIEGAEVAAEQISGDL